MSSIVTRKINWTKDKVAYATEKMGEKPVLEFRTVKYDSDSPAYTEVCEALDLFAEGQIENIKSLEDALAEKNASAELEIRRIEKATDYAKEALIAMRFAEKAYIELAKIPEEAGKKGRKAAGAVTIKGI